MDSLFSFALFSPSLPFLRLPHRLPLIVFFVIEIWQSGRSRPPASCQLTRDMRRLHADYTQITRIMQKKAKTGPHALFASLLYFLDLFYCFAQLFPYEQWFLQAGRYASVAPGVGKWSKLRLDFCRLPGPVYECWLIFPNSGW